ncbi:Uncharacterised protein [Legionella feeleii]|uniref:Uncharacterized protein n=1 Tax=Legionella feeleii TaxID=453 RepID=A0A2X1SS79_9GAMM|nr:Uncharacterised protein [Legionella feeleii]
MVIAGLATLLALKVIVPGVGGIPVLQSVVESIPGVTVTVQVAPGANESAQVVGTVVTSDPAGSPLAATTSPVAVTVPVLVKVTYRALPVNAGFLPIFFTDKANIDGGAMLVLNVVALGVWVRVISSLS